MPEYKYLEQVEKKIEAKPCPCCGGEDVNFYEANMDESVMSEHASVTCKICGHEVYVKGRYDIHRGSGRACLLEAIRRWDAQYESYRKPRSCYDEEKKLQILKGLLGISIKLELAQQYQDIPLDYDDMPCFNPRYQLQQILDEVQEKIAETEQLLAKARGEGNENG